jgi:excinuclease ABC subunit A
VVKRHHIPLNIPYGDLSAVHKQIILEGTPGEYYEVSPDSKYSDPNQVYKSKYEGVIPTLTRRYRETEVGDPFMKRISQYVTEVTCPTCSGYRLKKQYLSIFIDGLHIGQLSDLCVTDARAFFSTLKFGTTDSKIAAPILKNINERLEFLDGVGLSYMSLSRRANTLSGGESQRIRLATQIGTRLEGIIYVLDEPSIGLHPRDNQMLIANMRRLVDIGNTVIVVEHDEEVMAAADHIIDIGPRA